MPSKSSSNIKKVQKELEKKISPVLVVNNSTLKPYVELFNYAPENIFQQPLGLLLGFFEVKEYSEDSAYIVNFLTSVLKKEYYINPKRSVGESFDSALHKVNLALSELAKHGNVDWLGKLHASICVLENNNAHFSVVGGAKIFLYRNKTLTEISEDPDSETEPHPLKTFVNVSSGSLEKNDRLLITSEDIFHILPHEDLKKNFQRFEGEKFVQLLKTALSNQLEMIASIVVGLNEPEHIQKSKSSHKKAINTENVFSENTFTQVQAAANEIAQETALLTEELTDVNSPETYTDEKTGHIYIQGQTNEAVPVSKTQLFFEASKEKLGEIWYYAKNETRRRNFLLKKQLAKKIENWKLEREKNIQLKAEQRKLEEEEKQRLEEEFQQQLLREQEAEAAKIASEQEIMAVQDAITEQGDALPEVEEFEQAEIIESEQKLSFQEKLLLAKQQHQRNAVIDLRPKAATVEPEKIDEEIFEQEVTLEEILEPELPVKISLIKPESKLVKLQHHLERIGKFLTEKTKQALQAAKNLIAKKQPKIEEANSQQKQKYYTPRFSTIKKSFSIFTFKQKIYTLVAVVLIFVVPIFIARWINRPKPHPITEIETIKPAPTEKLASEKNIILSPKEQTVFNKTNLLEVLMTTAGPLTISKNSITLITNGKPQEYPIPINEGSVVRATFMSDLSTVFLLTDQNKVISFSPSTTKFTDNKINLPASMTNAFIGTYMTYLYVLDPSANQIYRFPRADGGFADKTNWYKDSQSLAIVSDMTIDDNIYCLQNNQILKLFKGQSQTLSLETSHTPFAISKIFTSLNSANLWALDTKNSRLVAFDKTDGNIVNQYFSDPLKDGSSLAVDEANKTAYVTTSSGLISIALQ